MGYTTINNNAIGLNTFIKQGDMCYYIILDDASGNKIRVRLDKAIVRQQAIIYRGTTYYKA